MKNLSGQIAVITGASSGIGKAIALSLAGEGLTLCLTGRSTTSLETVAALARETSPKVLSYPVDLTDQAEFNRFIEQLKADVSHVNLFIHCAGVLTVGRIKAIDMEVLDLQYRTNVRAAYALTKEFLPLIKHGAGQIVMMNSSIWQHARAELSQYASMKYALKAFTDSLRDEVNQDGIRVLSMFLGRTATPMLAELHQQQGTQYIPEDLIQPSDVAETLLHLLMLPRSAEVTDIHIRPMKKS
ncbi:MAG: short chain dehydrogenase [Nitrospirales bacterium]|nr:MAG: short chain dehydrogenase [Nitrospirales bacterium]